MLHSICGLQGGGKTLYCSLLGYLDYLSGRKIITNYDVFYPHYRINKDFITKLAIEQPDLPACTFLLDEYWLWYDSRDAMKLESKIGTYFFLQTSKNSINIFMTAQLNSQNESRIRNNTHRYSECERHELIDGKFKKVDDGERDLGIERNKRLYILVKNFKQSGNLAQLSHIHYETLAIKALPIFRLFNTYERKKIKI